jgi:hypothetical protein
MAPRWRRVLPWVIASAIACVGCNKKDEPTTDGGAIGTEGLRKRAPARLEPLELDELGAQPGLLADGAIFVAVRAGTAQDFLRHIPLPAEITRELAEARRDLGFDMLTDDVLARFSIPPDAIISMTLGRPVGVESRKALAKNLQHRDDRFLEKVNRVLNEGEAKPPAELWEGTKPIEEAVPVVPPAMPVVPEPAVPETPPPAKPMRFAPPAEPAVPPPVAPPIEIVPPIETPIVPPGESPWIAPPPPPPPEPITPTELVEINELLRQGDGVAIHFRVHIPSDDPSKIFSELRTRIGTDKAHRGETTCRGLAVELCISGGREVLVARRDGKAAVLDMVFFSGRSDRNADPEAVRRALTEAIGAPPAELPVLEKLAGHASAYIHAPAFVELATHGMVGQALRELEWNSTGASEGIRRHLDEAEQLRRLLDVERLFDGVLANAHHERDHTQLQITWPLREDQSALALAALAPPPIVVPVPSLAALCDGALACARSRGLPVPQELGTKLGMGIYGDARQLEDALDAADEAAAVVVLASTWPNALGTLLWHVPLAEARGPEAALARGLLDAVARIQGLGLSVRRIELGRNSFTGEYALYARMPVNDLGLVGTLLAMAELRMTPTTLDGVEGTITMLRIPEDDVPAVLMTREDPDTVKNAEGKDVRYGWLALVDGTERLKWLLEQPTDDGEEPYFHGEVPDLWRLVATVPEVVDELGFARTWATERALKTSLRLDDGQPQLLFDLALQRGAAAAEPR